MKYVQTSTCGLEKEREREESKRAREERLSGPHIRGFKVKYLGKSKARPWVRQLNMTENILLYVCTFTSLFRVGM